MRDWLKQSQDASDEIANALRTVDGAVYDLRRTTGGTDIVSSLEFAALDLRDALEKIASSRDLVLNEMLATTQDSFANITKPVLDITGLKK